MKNINNNLGCQREGGIDNILLLLNDCVNLVQRQVNDDVDLALDLSKFIDKSKYKSPYPINIYDYFGGLYEQQTSYFIREILDFRSYGDPILVKSFIKKFLAPIGFDINLVEKPILKCEEENVDILIWEEGKYSIVIENKLKGAIFQMNQLARYVELQMEKQYSDEQIFVVILPDSTETYKEHLNLSTWRLPPDWRTPSADRKCRFCDNTHCLCDFGKEQIENCTKLTVSLKRYHA